MAVTAECAPSLSRRRILILLHLSLALDVTESCVDGPSLILRHIRIKAGVRKLSRRDALWINRARLTERPDRPCTDLLACDIAHWPDALRLHSLNRANALGDHAASIDAGVDHVRTDLSWLVAGRSRRRVNRMRHFVLADTRTSCIDRSLHTFLLKRAHWSHGPTLIWLICRLRQFLTFVENVEQVLSNNRVHRLLRPAAAFPKTHR